MTSEETPTEAVERHASWAELFFDLVVVAGGRLALALYLLGVLASLASRGVQPTRILLWSVTGIAVPLLLAGFGDDLSATVLVWAVAAVCLSHLGYEWKVRAPDQSRRPLSRLPA